jgi:hypothetical protein
VALVLARREVLVCSESASPFGRSPATLRQHLCLWRSETAGGFGIEAVVAALQVSIFVERLPGYIVVVNLEVWKTGVDLHTRNGESSIRTALNFWDMQHDHVYMRELCLAGIRSLRA